MFNGFCGFVFERIRSFEVVKIAEVNYQNRLSTESIVQLWAKSYGFRNFLLHSLITQFYQSPQLKPPMFRGVANSHSTRVTEETIGLLCHKLAKLSSLFSAFKKKKKLKLQNWYQNVLFCLYNITRNVLF